MIMPTAAKPAELGSAVAWSRRIRRVLNGHRHAHDAEFVTGAVSLTLRLPGVSTARRSVPVLPSSLWLQA
jgi:hypothetical protein